MCYIICTELKLENGLFCTNIFSIYINISIGNLFIKQLIAVSEFSENTLIITGISFMRTFCSIHKQNKCL